MIEQMWAPPAPGTKAADLTNREQLVVARAAGLGVDFDIADSVLTMRSAAPFTIGDRPGGGYLVRWGLGVHPVEVLP